MAHIITEACKKADKACKEVCPVDGIVEGPEQCYINPETCVDCQACVSVCPTNAIFSADQVPDQWKTSVQKNADFFKK